MEISTEEAEARVKGISEFVTKATKLEQSVTPEQQAIYDVDYLLLEVNSGASFEQYFRWATLEEIGRVVAALRTVGLEDIAMMTEEAIAIAFPLGLPESKEEKFDQTDWTEDQEQQLGEVLFPPFEDQNGRITNVLAAYADRVGA